MGIFTFKKKKDLFAALGINFNEEFQRKLQVENQTKDFTDYSTSIKDDFGLFQKAVFKIFGDNKDIMGNSSFNLILKNKRNNPKIKDIKKLVNSISEKYGNDRNGKGKWAKEDQSSISTYWTGREWIVDKNGKNYKKFEKDCSQINLYYNIGDEIEFSILGANNLINNQ